MDGFHIIYITIFNVNIIFINSTIFICQKTIEFKNERDIKCINKGDFLVEVCRRMKGLHQSSKFWKLQIKERYASNKDMETVGNISSMEAFPLSPTAIIFYEIHPIQNIYIQVSLAPLWKDTLS